MTHTKIKNILDNLNQLEEDLMALPDDIWLSINPRDNESVEKGTAFLKSFNDNLSGFSESAGKISKQIKAHFEINPEIEEIEGEAVSEKSRSRIIKELDKSEPHTIDENFTYKRPFGFVLEDQAFKGIKTWRSLFIQALKVLAEKEQSKFKKLPEVEDFVSSRGKPLFTTDSSKLRMPEKTEMSFYVEVNLSANDLLKRLKNVMEYLKVNPDNFRVYLREDRDSENK